MTTTIGGTRVPRLEQLVVVRAADGGNARVFPDGRQRALCADVRVQGTRLRLGQQVTESVDLLLGKSASAAERCPATNGSEIIHSQLNTKRFQNLLASQLVQQTRSERTLVQTERLNQPIQ